MGEGSLTLPIKRCDWLRGGVMSSLTVSVCNEPERDFVDLIALIAIIIIIIIIIERGVQ